MYSFGAFQIVRYVIGTVQHVPGNGNTIHTQCRRWIHCLCDRMGGLKNKWTQLLSQSHRLAGAAFCSPRNWCSLEWPLRREQFHRSLGKLAYYFDPFLCDDAVGSLECFRWPHAVLILEADAEPNAPLFRLHLSIHRSKILFKNCICRRKWKYIL